MPEKTLKEKYLWGMALVLFVAACGVKWFYLAQQHYYIRLDAEALGAYDIAKTFPLEMLLRRLFLGCDYNLGSARPFFTNLLYILTYKGFGYEPRVVLTLGILVGSLLIPLYFLAAAALVNVEVALSASVILTWMPHYVYPCMALNTVIPGILFITGALLAAVRYHKGGGIGFLYLSGCLASMSVFCRFENVLLLPAFVGYEWLFDKKGRFSSKFVYGLLCAGSGFFILCCDYRCRGNPFFAMQWQSWTMSQPQNAVPRVPMTMAIEVVWGFLRTLLGLGPLPWVAAVAGMILMIKRYKFRALCLFLGALILPLFLAYKINMGTLDRAGESCFLLFPLIALSLGLECVRGFFSGLGRRRLFGIAAVGLVAVFFVFSCHPASVRPLNGRWYYPPKLMRLTEALKGIPATSVLYIDNVVSQPPEFQAMEVLPYVNRNPQKYVSGIGGRGGIDPEEKEYYLLTMEGFLGKLPKEDVVKVRDYRAFGYEGLVLYRVTRSREGK